jgi:KDO2-lipid IV(A) lauroyltransferase
MALLRVMPRRARGWIGISLGQLAYFIGIRRKTVIENLEAAFPGLPPKAVRKTAGKVFQHFGRVATSVAGLPLLSKSALNHWIFVENGEVMDAALAEGKGCIMASGHIGNWEIAGGIASVRGIPTSYVVTTQRNKLIEAKINHYREACGIEIIPRKVAMRGVLSALRRGRMVAMLIDQDAHEDGAFVPFFGRPASTPRGPAVFHLRTGAPLIFGYSTRLPGERILLHYERIDTTGITDADELTALLTQKLEAAIRIRPEQWFWMHRRWKTAPPKS